MQSVSLVVKVSRPWQRRLSQSAAGATERDQVDGVESELRQTAAVALGHSFMLMSIWSLYLETVINHGTVEALLHVSN